MWDWNFESTQMRKTGRTERDSDTEADEERKLADRDVCPRSVAVLTGVELSPY